MARSKANADLLELGIAIVNSLGEAGKRDLLANWMSHHLADRMRARDVAKGKERKQQSSECTKLILQLWRMRSAWPDGARPFEAFEPIFQTLQELSSGRPRNPLVRASPEPDRQPSKLNEILNAARVLDYGASFLIRKLLTQAALEVPSRNRHWTRLRSVIERSDWDVSLVVQLIGIDTNDSEQDRIKKVAIADIERSVEFLKTFQTLAKQIEDQLATRRKSLGT
jgi:hypothetical protein